MHFESIQTIIFAVNAGILCLLLSEFFKLPSMLFYLFLGIIFGPHVVGLIQPASLGELLPAVIEIAVAIIIFEGALSLNYRQYLATSSIIRNVLTIGPIITISVITVLSHFLMELPWGLSFIFGSLMCITGPTVIAPILRRVPLKPPLDSILNWESILLDPIGAILALLALEILISEDVSIFATGIKFLRILLGGAAVGVFIGYVLSTWFQKRPIVNHGIRNLVVLAMALLIFQISNMIVGDSGLVAVVAAGLIIGNQPFPFSSEIREFKETITLLLISFLFVLLAANLDLHKFLDFPPKVIILIALIMFVVRPIGIFISTRQSQLDVRSKIFLSLIAPRGIVVASMASLAALILANNGKESYGISILTYQVIAVTVVFSGFLAPLLAWALRAREKVRRGFLIVGAHRLAREIGKFLQEHELDVILVDRDSFDVGRARAEGLTAFKGDALDESFLSGLPLSRIGNLLAITSNDEVNTLACQLGRRIFGDEKIFQTHRSLDEGQEEKQFLKQAGGQIIFPLLEPILDVLSQLRRENLHFISVKGNEQPEGFVPLFIGDEKTALQLVSRKTEIKDSSPVWGLVPTA